MTNGAPQPVPRFISAAGGWTIAELVMVLVIAAVLATVVAVRFKPLETLSLQQAERLRNDLRHAQMLALTWGRPLRLTTTAGSYSVGCVSAGTAPCNVNPVIDPATGQPFSVTLETGLTLGGPATLDFDAIGAPSAGATFTVSGGGPTRNVLVTSIAGLASVQ